MFGNFTEEARKVLVNAKKEMLELKHPYVGSEHLLLSILKNNNKVSQKLKEYNLDYQKLKEEIIEVVGIGNKPSDWFLYTPLLKRVIENAITDSKENNNSEVTIEHLFSSLLEEGEGVAIRIIIGMDIDIDELYSEFSYKIVPKNKKNKKLLLEELGIDLNKKAINKEVDPVVGRDNEIKRILEILSRRSKNNPVLVGDAGVGKTAIVEELSRMIVNNEVPLSLKNKRIISLDMATTVAGTKYRGEFEERVRKILKEIEENDDIILFIDELHTLVGAGGAEGAIDASNIFKPALARNKLRCIGATTLDEYKKYIEEDSALERRFQKVIIESPTKETVKEILMKLKKIYEKFHLVTMSEEIIDLIIELSNKYIYDRNEPDRSIDLMDEVCAKVSLMESKELKKYNKLNKEIQEIIKNKNEAIMNNKFKEASIYKEKENEIMNKINNIEISIHKNKSFKEVMKLDVAEVINIKTKIPVYEILNDNKEILKQINKNLTNNIIGQEKVIKNIMKTIKRIKLGYKDDNVPYSFLFVGPSGVGKTKLALLFGENMVGNNVIRLDMSEYMESHSISKIVGAPPGYVGYSDNKNILEEIKNKPYSLIILDEIEKAHPDVLNLFFQILDNGKMKDSKGKTIRFDNTIIVMTSNIGFNENNIGFNIITNDNIITKLKEYFSLPFINRIDSIQVFEKLDETNINKLIKSKLQKIKNKYKDKKIKVDFDNGIIKEISEESNYEEFGARKLDKIIKDKVDNYIIENILNDNDNIVMKSIKENVII